MLVFIAVIDLAALIQPLAEKVLICEVVRSRHPYSFRLEETVFMPLQRTFNHPSQNGWPLGA